MLVIRGSSPLKRGIRGFSLLDLGLFNFGLSLDSGILCAYHWSMGNVVH